MMNFNNRRDQSAPPADTAKPVLKPAIYDPPGNTAAPARAAAAHGAEAPNASRPGAPPPSAPAAGAAGAKPNAPDAPESKLFVGVNIQLKGVEISIAMYWSSKATWKRPYTARQWKSPGPAR